MAKLIVETAAKTFIRQAVAEHEKFVAALRDGKTRAFDCGLYLLSAQGSLGSNEVWEDLLEEFKLHFPRRTAFHYMRFSRDMLEWTAQMNPRAKGEKLNVLARDIVLQSAGGFLDLCREVAAILRPLEGGGRRSENAKPGQMFFDFGFFSDTLFLLGKGGQQLLKDVPTEKLENDRLALGTAQALMDAELASRAGERAREAKLLADAQPEADSTKMPEVVKPEELAEVMLGKKTVKKKEVLVGCPKCGQHGFTERGLKAHVKTKTCRERAKEKGKV